MYNHIIVPLDRSKLAEQVLPYVEALAQKFGSTITLVESTISSAELMAESLSGFTAPGAATVIRPSIGIDPTPIVEYEHTHAEHYLTTIAVQLQQQGITVNQVQREGHAQDVIVDLARETGADLIAMTTHGRSGLQRIVYGSVADSVLRHAPCPVLLVRVHTP